MIKKILITLGKLVFKEQEPRLPDRPKIAVLKAGAIGDVLMTTPLLHALRKRYPAARMDYYVGPWAGKALETNTRIDNLVVLDRQVFYSPRVTEVLKAARRIRKEKYDVLFTLDKSYLAGLMGWLCGVKVRVGLDRRGEGFAHTVRVPYNNTEHEIDQYLKLGYALGLAQTKDKRMELPLTSEDKAHARKFFSTHKIRKAITIAPGGGKNPGERDDIRRAPTSLYVDICKELAKKHHVIMIGGPSDKVLCDVISQETKSKRVINTAGQTSLRESGALMALCDAAVCNDSGPMHIAGAVGARVIGIFGPTNPSRKLPPGENNRSVWKDQDRYYPPYEYIGAKPNKTRYFSRLRAKDILNLI